MRRTVEAADSTSPTSVAGPVKLWELFTITKIFDPATIEASLAATCPRRWPSRMSTTRAQVWGSGVAGSPHPYTGHYLSAVEDGANSLTTLRLRNFAEEIDVYAKDGALLTDHRFDLNGIRFLTLHYTIDRKPNPAH